MATIDASKVQELLGTTDNVDSFVATAQLILDESLDDKGLSDARLEQIGQYLAAHYALITRSKGQVVEEEVDDARQKRGGKYSEGLNATLFGQQAIQLDSSGCLAGMAKSHKVLKPVLRIV